jgi:hypothetical protein
MTLGANVQLRNHHPGPIDLVGSNTARVEVQSFRSERTGQQGNKGGNSGQQWEIMEYVEVR